jgi:hypothetical protein
MSRHEKGLFERAVILVNDGECFWEKFIKNKTVKKTRIYSGTKYKEPKLTQNVIQS